jgi:UDP-glucose 4-epimerase
MLFLPTAGGKAPLRRREKSSRGLWTRFDLNQTFQLLRNITGYSGDVKYAPERHGDVKHSLADLTRTEKHLGYKPLVNFEEGLRRTVEWYRGQPKAKGV